MAYLSFKVKAFDDFFYVVAKTIEVCIHVGFELGWITQQRFQGPFRCVVKYIPRDFPQAASIEFRQLEVLPLILNLIPQGLFGRL